MNYSRAAIVLGVVVMAAYAVVNVMALADTNDQLAEAKAELRAAKDSLASARERAEAATVRADSLQAVAERDSVERVEVVRTIEREIEVDLSRARASEDTLRYVLEEVYPIMLPTLDRMLAGYESARARTDSLLTIERAAHDQTRKLLVSWRETAWLQETRAERAESALARAEHAVQVAERRDIDLFGLVSLDVTCGLGGGAGVGLRGPDLQGGFYCVLGR